MPGQVVSESFQGYEQQLAVVGTTSDIVWLRIENVASQQHLAGLECRVGFDSSNNGKPPFSDRPRKPTTWRRTNSSSGHSGECSGGQPVPAVVRLWQTDAPDHLDTHLVLARGAVTEHEPHSCWGEACGHVTWAEFPDGPDAIRPVHQGHGAVPARLALAARVALGGTVSESARGPCLRGHAGRHEALVGALAESERVGSAR